MELSACRRPWLGRTVLISLAFGAGYILLSFVGNDPSGLKRPQAAGGPWAALPLAIGRSDSLVPLLRLGKPHNLLAPWPDCSGPRCPWPPVLCAPHLCKCAKQTASRSCRVPTGPVERARQACSFSPVWGSREHTINPTETGSHGCIW